jgi:hypothetical protein
LQEEARDGILCFRGQSADGFNSAFEQFGHAPLYHKWASPGQPKTPLTFGRHSCTKKAVARQGLVFCAEFLNYAHGRARWPLLYYVTRIMVTVHLMTSFTPLLFRGLSGRMSKLNALSP